MLLSIIVPMYNVSPYLEKCISHIQIKDVEYEILMINDGSPDDSLEVATELSKNNHRIKIFSQENKGLGGARNLGIKNAKGKYILFLDADDILIMQKFYFLNNESSQIIQLGSNSVDESGNIITVYIPNDNKKISGINYWINNKVNPSACNKLYKRQYLLNNNFLFKERIYSEDIEFNTRVFFKVKELSSYPKVIQHFVQTKGSITRNTNNKQKLYNDLICIINSFITMRARYLNFKNQTIFFNKIISDMVLGTVNLAIKLNVPNNDIYNLLKKMKHNDICIYSIKYDNNKKNLYKKILMFPYSVSILKILKKNK